MCSAILLLAAGLVAADAQKADDTGWVPLFNGKDMIMDTSRGE